MRKWITFLATGILAVGLLVGCGGGDAETAGDAEAGDVVVVGTNAMFEPFEFQDGSGNIEGFDIDLMTAIGESQGFSIEINDMGFDALTGAIQNGSIDVIASGMSITPDRLKAVNFTKPYMDASLGIVVPEDNSDINNSDDLAGKVVAAQIGTTGADAAQELADEGVVAEVKIYDNFNTCVQALLNGEIDAIINDMPVNQAYMERQPGNVRIAGEPFVVDFYGLAVAKDNEELLQRLNDGLDAIIADGTFEELCKKYDLPVPQSIVDGTAEAPTA